MCAPCSSPRNAEAARRETSSREAIERVTIVIPVSIDRRPARNRPAAHPPRTNRAFWAGVDERDFVRQVIVQAFAALRGRPPLAPLERAAAAFAGDLARPATRANSRAIQARVPKTPATRAGT